MSGSGPDDSASSPTNRTRILVVDDDKTITRMLDAMLRRALGVDVLIANAAFGVLNIIAAERPRIVLLDVMMPGLDGQSLTGLIRADKDLAKTRVVLYSAMDETALGKLRETCGADDFVPKTLRPTEVARRLARWL
jgi:DNA-binding response OmpR family regulator